MQQKMKYHAGRQAVLAQNVSNVDTPGYKAQDLVKPDFSAALTSHMSAKSMVTTNPMHMQPGGGGKGGSGKIAARENSYELNPIGNNVTIEEEMMRVAENQSEYQKVLGIYRKSIEMFRIALGKGGAA